MCIIAAILLIAACNDFFHEYRSVGGSWLPSDTLTFEYCRPDGEHRRCAVDVELRSGSNYPYKEILLRLECVSRRLKKSTVDTLVCELYDEKGHPCGTTAGLLRQTSYAADTIDIVPGDTIEIKVSHLMDDAPIVGILDVGVRLSHLGRHQF